MTSPAIKNVTPAEVAGASTHEDIATQSHQEDETVEVDNDADSAYGDSVYSDSTSISSSIRRGIIEHGRRYQTLREGKYWGPSDDKAFESMNISHSVYLTLDSKQSNPLFRSPIGENVHNILDLGTGDATWAFDVADFYPGAHVTGVDLYPPPRDFTPPNCELLVDDVMKPWMFDKKFELIHARFLVGSFTPEGWKGLYKQAYDNLVPGGWFEAVEPSLEALCDDGSLPPDSKNAKWGPMFHEIGKKVTGHPMDISYTMKDLITATGFINVHEKQYKIPIGNWAKDSVLKQAGKLYLEEVTTGLEGYAMLLLTRAGLPKPWSPEEVRAHCAGIREEWANPEYHMYTRSTRTWAQKPHDAADATA